MTRKGFVLSIVLIMLSSAGAWATGQGHLERLLKRYIHPFSARVGVAVILNGRDTLTVNGDETYPMASTYKFPQALAALDKMGRRGIPLDSVIPVTKSDLHPNTHSPIRELYPYGTNLSFAELLSFSLRESDNNACDKIFSTLVTPSETNRYIRSLGILGMHIATTELAMQRDLKNTYRNTSTPLAMASLWNMFVSHPLIGGEYDAFLRQAVVNVKTGSDRLPAPLDSVDAIVGHKTGTGAVDYLGRRIAFNDAGFVILPDGRYYAIAVFVKNSRETPVTNAAIIAGISAIVYRYVTGYYGSELSHTFFPPIHSGVHPNLKLRF